MSKNELDIIKYINDFGYISQRDIAQKCGYSLGSVNNTISSLIEQGYIDKNMKLTAKFEELIKKSKPKNAIILAAGYGMRMVPINTEKPKALLNVKKEVLIERLIKQLHEAGIYNIDIIVGFMKEEMEYLIDEYNVNLIVNNDYSIKNNLYSLAMDIDNIANTYIIPCDLYFKNNPFNFYELYSYYMVSDNLTLKTDVVANKKGELRLKNKNELGNKMIGLSYIDKECSEILKKNIISLKNNPLSYQMFWEEALYIKDRMLVYSKIINDNDVKEINTYEELRDFDNESDNLKSKAINEVSKALGVDASHINRIKVLKKGMTNRSFLFSCDNDKYIMRIPGEETDKLINRREEANVYEAIKDRGICDDIIYINPNNGYKITRYLNDSRVCDPNNLEDLAKCMDILRGFHSLKLKVDHEFDIFAKAEFYEALWYGKPSVYRDYAQTKENVFSLRDYINKNIRERILTHIDAVPDNFLFSHDENGKEIIRLIDWEYAAMQDPDLDIAMFCIYALYNRKEIDRLIDIYYKNSCPKNIRIKIYCYIAAGGLLWSNWCEYKRNLGVEFGEYSLRQYRYAKDYYRIAIKEMRDLNV